MSFFSFLSLPDYFQSHVGAVGDIFLSFPEIRCSLDELLLFVMLQNKLKTNYAFLQSPEKNKHGRTISPFPAYSTEF